MLYFMVGAVGDLERRTGNRQAGDPAVGAVRTEAGYEGA